MTRAQKYAAAFWISAISSLLGIDWVVNEQHAGLTLSERVREAKDSVPHGDYVFLGVWATFSIWFAKHILKKIPASA